MHDDIDGARGRARNWAAASAAPPRAHVLLLGVAVLLRRVIVGPVPLHPASGSPIVRHTTAQEVVDQVWEGLVEEVRNGVGSRQSDSEGTSIANSVRQVHPLTTVSVEEDYID